MQTRIVAVALALAFTACAADPDEPTLSETSSEVRCAPWMCGSNSPIIDNHGFHELNVAGLANAEGFRLVSIDRNGIHYRMRVIGGQIGLTPSGGGDVLTGPSVNGAVMHVVYGPTNAPYDILIAGTERTPMWANLPGAMSQTMTYELSWSVPGFNVAFPWHHVCANPSKEGMEIYHSVVFEGDRIDAQRKVDTGLDADWFSIGCAGSALAKLHLTGHTEGAQQLGYVTNLVERTTMLKMLTGDYCGTGEPFTVAGTPLLWRDNKGWMTYPTGFATVEAHWGVTGAKCLDTPRLDANPSELGDETFGDGGAGHPDIRALIGHVCSIPSCQWSSTQDHLVSANPN